MATHDTELGSHNWVSTTWGELVELRYGRSLKGYKDSDGEFPVYGTNGPVGWCSKPLCDFPSVIVGRKGAYRGIHYSDKPFFVIDTAFYINPKVDLNLKWAYYALLLVDINGMDSGSAIPSTSREDFYAIPVKVPPRGIQNWVVEQLDSYNEKIEINRKINVSLESIAQALFKSFFVDFDPVIDNALKAGSPIPDSLQSRAERRAALHKNGKLQYSSLPAEIQKLFPSSFVFNKVLGWVPEGWNVFPLDGIAKYQNGLALQKFRPENENEFLPVVKIAQLKKGFSDGEEKASPNINPECIIDNGDVVFSWSGSLMVDTWCGGQAALNQHLFKVTSENYPKWLYLHFTKHHLDEFRRIAADKAVTMGHIKREHLKQAYCALPNSTLVTLLGELIDPLIQRAIDCRLESALLGEIRDGLLPKLLSGQIQLPEV